MKKHKNIKRTIWVVALVGLCALGFKVYQNVSTITANNETGTQIHGNTVAPVSTTASDDELKSIMSEPGFQASQKLQARQILADRRKTAESTKNKAEVDQIEQEYKAKVDAEKNRHDTEMASIEKDLEGIRQDELTLGTKSPSF